MIRLYYISLHRQVDYVSFESECPDSKDNNKNSVIRACNPRQKKHKDLIMSKISAIIITIAILFIPLTTLAQSDGIPLQKDVFLEYPIATTDDPPDQLTFNLYNSQTATTPIGAQTFQRGQYTVDFEFSKSDGRTSQAPWPGSRLTSAM